MKDLIKFLVELQEIDTRIIEKRFFIDKVPLRIHEVDEPLKRANAELEKIKQKTDALAKKKREKELFLEETNEKIGKMKGRVSEIKTNKEYQAYLKEIESSEKGITLIEDEILDVMEELDSALKQRKEKEEQVNREVEKINAFKRELDRNVERYEEELASLKEERAKRVAAIDPDVYGRYMTLLKTGSGVAVTQAKNELCTGCNMNIPPQLYVEIRKNEEVIQCPQCLRILFYLEDQADHA